MNATVIIPSLNPDEKIVSTVQSLIDEGFDDIVLVDDGSKEEYKHRFEEAKALGNVTLLVHEVNLVSGYQLLFLGNVHEAGLFQELFRFRQRQFQGDREGEDRVCERTHGSF